MGSHHHEKQAGPRRIAGPADPLRIIFNSLCRNDSAENVKMSCLPKNTQSCPRNHNRLLFFGQSLKNKYFYTFMMDWLFLNSFVVAGFSLRWLGFRVGQSIAG